jgi:hypothetical protein
MRLELEVKPRRRGFTVHEDCFLGSEAFELIMTRFVPTEAVAKEIGNQLMRMGVFLHVSGSHSFKNKSSSFYKFSKDGNDDEDEDSELSGVDRVAAANRMKAITSMTFLNEVRLITVSSITFSLITLASVNHYLPCLAFGTKHSLVIPFFLHSFLPSFVFSFFD